MFDPKSENRVWAEADPALRNFREQLLDVGNASDAMASFRASKPYLQTGKSDRRALAEAFIGGAVAMLIIVLTIGGILVAGMAFS